MIRGTTAQFKFKLPYTLGELQWVVMQFWQPGNNGTPDAPLPIVKRKTKIAADGTELLFGDSKEILVSLTSHETLRFTDKLKARVQLRAQHTDGTVFASHQELVTVYPLSDDLIHEEVLPGENNDGWIVLDGESVM